MYHLDPIRPYFYSGFVRMVCFSFAVTPGAWVSMYQLRTWGVHQGLITLAWPKVQPLIPA